MWGQTRDKLYFALYYRCMLGEGLGSEAVCVCVCVCVCVSECVWDNNSIKLTISDEEEVAVVVTGSAAPPPLSSASQHSH